MIEEIEESLWWKNHSNERDHGGAMTKEQQWKSPMIEEIKKIK